VTTSGGGAGGGAGAGYFGGGGGSGGGGVFGGGGGAGGGGGGGASFAAPSIIGPALTSGANPGTINDGNGEVIITWVPSRGDDPEAPATTTSADLLTALSPSAASATCWRWRDQAVYRDSPVA
jgi:hypothetical protein